MVKVKEDLTGKRFGRLTVLEQAEDKVRPNGVHEAAWLCRCDCGNKAIVRGSNLRYGVTKSCGCLKETQSSITHKKYNYYEFYNNYGICYDDKHNKIYFDLEDYDKIKNMYWSLNGYGYACHRNNDSTTIRMHRLIMNCPDDLIIDHKNHNRIDNRKNNLRFVTKQQNNINTSPRITNTSGVTGVNWDKAKGKWQAYINYNCKHFFLGYYNNFDDAVKARKRAEEKYFGEYSYNNSISKGDM